MAPLLSRHSAEAWYGALLVRLKGSPSVERRPFYQHITEAQYGALLVCSNGSPSFRRAFICSEADTSKPPARLPIVTLRGVSALRLHSALFVKL